MLAGTLAFTTGIYCLMQFSYLPSLWLIAILLPLFFLARFFSAFRLVFIFSIGFCWALFRADSVVERHLKTDYENMDVFIKGTVISLPQINQDHVRFLLNVNNISDLKATGLISPGTIRLSWYKTKSIPSPGEIWQFKTKLKRPYGFMNPGNFDYEFWVMRQGISAIGYVKPDDFNKKIGHSNKYPVQILRHKFAVELNKMLDKPLLGFVLALSLGDRSKLEPEQWDVLTRTGTNHLIAISGLHLSLVAGFIYFLSRFFWSWFYFLTQRIPAPVFGSLMAFAGAFFYALLSGFALPTQRALIMIGVFIIALFSATQTRLINVLCIALVLVLVVDPFAIIAADFWLSFMAVIFILYITRYRLRDRGKFKSWLRLQCLLSIALCPLLIFWFKQIPLYSVLANLIAIPVIGLLIVPLILVALVLLFTIPVLSHQLYGLVDIVNNIHWRFLEFISQQNHAIIPVASPNLFSLLLALSGVFLLLMPRGLPGRWLGIMFLLPLLFPVYKNISDGEFIFNLLDVGQGLSVVIETNQHTLIYDAGAKYSEKFNMGDAVLKPYLRYKGTNDISMLLVSHGDNDHIGGANVLTNNYKIDRILTSVPEKFDLYKAEMCQAEQKWHWDSVDFEILHPKPGELYEGNNSSCVLRVSSRFGSVLLTGDIEKRAERNLINSYGTGLQADILQVPHHGSKTSSTEEFISAVSPKYAFIPAGYRNRFGFPKQDIIARYEALGIETRVSYKTGALSAKFSESGLQINEFRTSNRRFWHY
jgi:competence protein ComEC